MKIKDLTYIVYGITIFLIISSFTDSTKLPEGWFSAGKSPNDYEMGVDTKIFYTGNSSGYIKAKSTSTNGFGTLMQMCIPGEYLGTRVKMSAYIKTEGVEEWAAMWMRVDGSGETLSFDNMQDRPIKGSLDWKRYEIVLNVPEDSKNLAYGILLDGSGQAWIDAISFEIVKDSPTTDMNGEKIMTKPSNLDFE